MWLLNYSALSQLRQTVSKWEKGRKENPPSGWEWAGAFWAELCSLPQPYLDDPAVHRHCGADHVHVWGGGGALSLGQRALRGRVGWVESEGMRCRIPVLGAEKERETKGELWLFFFPLSLLNVTCPKAIYTQFEAEKSWDLHINWTIWSAESFPVWFKK